MAISPEFEAAVSSNNKLRVRIMLKNSMQSDLTMRDFEEKLKYAESKLPDLYEAHDGESLNNDISTWNLDALDTQTARLIDNFSRERVDYVKRMVRHLYADQVKVAEREAFLRDEKGKSKAKAIGTAMVVGGGVAVAADFVIASRAVTTGMAACHPALAVVGFVAMVGGSVIIAKNK